MQRLHASKDAKLVYGLKRERTEQQMRDAIAKGTLMKDLQWVPVKKDDLFFIEAGTMFCVSGRENRCAGSNVYSAGEIRRCSWDRIYSPVQIWRHWT